tara:strand:- start:469 stop:708 length:240 start_codon:yes stop_codon:yes gene_type:complete
MKLKHLNRVNMINNMIVEIDEALRARFPSEIVMAVQNDIGSQCDLTISRGSFLAFLKKEKAALVTELGTLGVEYEEGSR